MKKTILLGICMFFLVLPFIYADDIIYLKQDTKTDLKIGCSTENNSKCDNTTSCTLTVSYPDYSDLVIGANMTYNTYYFNYTFNDSLLNVTGIHPSLMDCIGPENGQKRFYLYVTPSGTEYSTSQGMTYSILLVVLLVMFIFSTIGAFVLNGKNEYDVGGKLLKVNLNKHYKIGLFFLSYLLLIFISFIGWQISLNFLLLGFASTVLSIIHSILWIFLGPVFIAFVVLALIKWTLDTRLQDLADRNLKPYGGKKW